MIDDRTTIVFHQQCYEYVVMNSGSRIAKVMFRSLKDDVIPFREGIVKYNDWFEEEMINHDKKEMNKFTPFNRKIGNNDKEFMKE